MPSTPGIVGSNYPATSLWAARDIAPATGTLRAKVLAYIAGCGDAGATDEEIQAALKMNPSTQRPRRIELARDGRIKALETKRKTTSVRWAQVWVVNKGV